MRKRGFFLAAVGLFLLGSAAWGAVAEEPQTALSAEEVYGWAATQSGFGPRRPGTPAFDQAGEQIARLLTEWGLEVWTDSIPLVQYFPARWTLEVISPDGRRLDAFPLWHSGPTPAEGVTAELVDLGKGNARAFRNNDVAGKVVLVNWGHRFLNLMSLAAFSNSYARAIENGAAGYLQFYTNTPGNSYALVSVSAGGGGGAIPGFSLGKEDAKELRRQLKRGAVRVQMELVSEERETPAENIFAMLAGRTEEIILIDTHYCSAFAGAFDNASGVAAALALAKHFAGRPRAAREKTLVFSFYGSHEYYPGDCNQGARKFLADNPELAKRVAAAVGLDHLANYPDKEIFGHTFRLRPLTPLPGLDQPRGVFITRDWALARIVFPALLKYRLIPFVVFPNRLMDAIPAGEPGDQWNSLLMWCICESGPAFRQGVPTVRILMAPQWYHTPLDTLDHFTPAQLKRAVDAHIEILEKIDRTPAEKLKASETKSLGKERH